MINVVEELKKIGLGLGFILILIFIIRFFHLVLYQIVILLVSIQALFMIYNKSFSFKELGKSAIYITVFYTLLRYVGKFGVAGYVVSIALICSAILYRKREQYFKVKWHIEALIWGKPLKEFKEEGKKPPKLEFDW